MNFTKDEATKSYSLAVDADNLVEIGDKDTPAEFLPHFKLKKWNDDANFTFLFPSASGGTDTTVSLDRITWQKGDMRMEAYYMPPDEACPSGGMEFAVIFDAKPTSNFFILQTTLKKSAFHFQGPVTDDIGTMGIVTADETTGYDAGGNPIVHRPANVVNSYAIYYEDMPVNNGIKNQKSGKIGHIYRIKATDAGNNSVWCDMTLVGINLKITIPQDFLDSAVYPVVVDPTFGYTSVGGSSIVYNSPGSLCHVGAGLVFTPASGYNRIIKMSIYGCNDGSPGSVQMAGYTISGGIPVTRINAPVTVNLPGAPQWNDTAALSIALTNGVTYGIAEGTASHATVYYDLGIGSQRGYCLTNLPATWVEEGVSGTLYSWYATYETINYSVCSLIQDD